MAKILLVEDDNNLREIYEARLKAEGYNIVGASNGEEALVVAKKEMPDLVIADVMMPRISGFEMLDILRNTKGLEHVKVIMLTALGQAEDKTRADQLGADRYLVKSQVTLEDIVKATSDLLAGDGISAAPVNPAASSPVSPRAGASSTQPASLSPAATTGPQPQTMQPAAQPVATQQPMEPVAPPPEPQADTSRLNIPAPQPTQPQTQPVAPTPTPAPSTIDNTTQLNNAVKDLINDTNGGGTQPVAAQTQQPRPTAANQPAGSDGQTASADDEGSVTLGGKRTIKPLSGNGPEKPHINDLLAKEEAANPTQFGQPIGGDHPQLPTTPHPAGHVFSPTSSPQPNNNPPATPDDPSKIAL